MSLDLVVILKNHSNERTCSGVLVQQYFLAVVLTQSFVFRSTVIPYQSIYLRSPSVVLRYMHGALQKFCVDSAFFLERLRFLKRADFPQMLFSLLCLSLSVLFISVFIIFPVLWSLALSHGLVHHIGLTSLHLSRPRKITMTITISVTGVWFFSLPRGGSWLQRFASRRSDLHLETGY